MFYLVQVLIERGLLKLNRPFSYAYFGSEPILKGVRVKVKFNNADVIGFVTSCLKYEGSLEDYFNQTKIKLNQIEEIIDEYPILDDDLLRLADVISSYYYSPKIEILKAMLPPSLRPNSTSKNKPKEHFIYKYYLTDKKLDISLNKDQLKLYNKLSLSPLSKSQISSKKSLEFLEKNGFVELRQMQIYISPVIEFEKEEMAKLNPKQEEIYNKIINSDKKVSLLQGVTGSGKTEIYINLVNYYLNRGFGSIVLVPEISLTDRLISKFKSIFNKNVALLHSGLTDAQKYGEYLRIRKGEAKIVVGTRSAIFAPINNLGIIIVDEEHVESYKQDVKPFYDARKVSLIRSELSNCKVVFGSATPLIETKAKAENNLYQMLYLNDRYNDVKLPKVEIVDLSKYDNIDYNSILISLPLREKLKEVISKHKQAILLLNRRGYSPIYTCRKCQRVLKCPNCSLPLTYHKKDNKIICHHCEYELNSEDLVCPNCHSRDFIYTGFGTERIEEEIHKFFPQARIVRLDSDITRKKGQYHKILTDFANSKYDIMIGTQMVAKGHDFPNVILAVALLADQALEFPSYKANEDTFDLLTQLIGRSGRKSEQGYAMIQTYSPSNKVIKFAQNQDYEGFYKFEMENRKIRKYPPYVYLINLTISASSKDKVIEASLQVKNFLVGQIINKNKRADIFGPAVPFIEKVNNRYYRKIMIKYKDGLLIRPIIEQLLELSFSTSDVQLSIDVDPSSDI